jgi:hypothetical protein
MRSRLEMFAASVVHKPYASCGCGERAPVNGESSKSHRGFSLFHYKLRLALPIMSVLPVRALALFAAVATLFAPGTFLELASNGLTRGARVNQCVKSLGCFLHHRDFCRRDVGWHVGGVEVADITHLQEVSQLHPISLCQFGWHAREHWSKDLFKLVKTHFMMHVHFPVGSV